MALGIGTVSQASGVKIPTIRFYEQIGLLPKAARTTSNRRRYGEEDVQRLRFIRHARELGFEIEDIRTLLALTQTPHAPCLEADQIAQRHLATIDHRIGQLTALKAEIERIATSCAGNAVRTCRVIEALGETPS
ncbi:MAG: helix-turn-helix domain-containing protein [Alphaproteobacteria bacterium]|nr:helix-turn-helix domain-containing protein [Alphaproteobacteria bacterium]